jgi:peptidoglycan hydrolase CwlO-like protein
MTQASSLWGAIRLVWRAGVAAYQKEPPLDALEASKARLEQELLSLSQLVHDYETKIHNNVRENQELTKKSKELEWGYRALLRENQWLREEIFKLKGRPLV